MNYAEVSVAGAIVKVRAAQVNGKTVVVTGDWLKVASVKDEVWQEGIAVPVPGEFIAEIRRNKKLGADLFTFGGKLSSSVPRFPYHFEWDSVAAIPTSSFSDWWENRVSTDLRKDVRRSAKRGVAVRIVSYTDEFVRGIMGIYDETPVRQGGRFWHYKKSFESVKVSNSTYLERSTFLGAFFGEELIGFLKMVFVDDLACLMQIISKDAHRDKRPMNALIAKAVEVCEAHGCTHLTYGKYQYPQGPDSLTAFKHRNGFEEILVPKYYVPLTMEGKLALFLHLHHGVRALVPRRVQRVLKRIKASGYKYSLSLQKEA
jgi:hypothetical protein